MPDRGEERVKAEGSILTLDGEVIAVAASDHNAKIIALCLNLSGVGSSNWSLEDRAAVEGYFE